MESSHSESHPTGKRHTALTVLGVAAFVLALLATLMVFAQDRIFDAEDFSSAAASTLSDPGVNEYLADAVADELIEAEPNLAIGGPLLENVVGSVLESPAATEVVATATFEAHIAFFGSDTDGLLLELSDLVVTIDTALSGIDPEYAESIPDELETLAVDVSAGEAFPAAARLARTARRVTYVLVALTVAALLGIVWLEPKRWHSLGRVGLILGIVGLFVVVAMSVGDAIVASYGRNALEANAISGVWNVVLGDLRVWGWVLLGVGAFVSGLAWSLRTVGRTTSFLRSLSDRMVSPPETTGGRVAQLVTAGAIAVWAIVEPGTLLTSAVRVAGFLLAVGVTQRIMQLTGLDQRVAAVSPEQDDVTDLRGFARRAAIPLVLLAGLGGVATLILSNDNTALASNRADGCNGYEELCDRRLDEVTVVASHNSMSSTETSFLLPNHLSTITEQLDAGIRGLMIDTHLGRPDEDGTVITQTGLLVSDSIDADSQAAVDAIRARATEELGDEAVYLCHSFCEIGALDAVDALTSIRNWLEDNPREVLIIMVQDATEPADTAAAFEDAGLDELVWTQVLADPFPTLGQMIDADRRLFVMVEENGDGVDWLHPAFVFSQETPFSFGSVDEFSCEPNRGQRDSPLFVVNHFITLAVAENQTINDADVLLTRAEKCRDERGLRPNLLAVDFATRGDAVAVAAELNGLGQQD